MVEWYLFAEAGVQAVKDLVDAVLGGVDLGLPGVNGLLQALHLRLQLRLLLGQGLYLVLGCAGAALDV